MILACAYELKLQFLSLRVLLVVQYTWTLVIKLSTLSAHVQEGYSSCPVRLSVGHALIMEITDN